MRYALDIFPESPDKSEVLLAATPEEMRGILDRLTTKALKGQIPAEAFAQGINELGHAGVRPNYIGRNIRNTLKDPFARTLVDNPGLAEGLANSMVGQLDSFGFDSGAMKGMIGPGMDLMRQAKKDGLLKPDVSDEVVAEQIQRPLYSAFRDYMRDNRNDPRLNELIKSAAPWVSGPGTPLEIYGAAADYGLEPESSTRGGLISPIR